ISLTPSRTHIKKLIKDGRVIVKPTIVHSRTRTRDLLAAKRKGRYTGPGKRKVPLRPACPSKRLLRKYREGGKIDKHLCLPLPLHHSLYMKSRGNG
ncbi:hypothetical protein SISNIDRAFT_388563, partial [Sistotremastrum niveocremeum HHB9708]